MAEDNNPRSDTRQDALRYTPACLDRVPLDSFVGVAGRIARAVSQPSGDRRSFLPIRVFFIGRRDLLSFALSNPLNHLIHHG